MNTDLKDDIGKLILRLTLGVLMLFHGVAKVSSGPEKIMGMVVDAGLPAFIGYGVYLGELVAPLLIVLGVLTRPAALVVAINMIAAVFLVHLGHFFDLSKSGGWSLELQAFFFFTAIAVAFTGAGKLSLGGKNRWN